MLCWNCFISGLVKAWYPQVVHSYSTSIWSELNYRGSIESVESCFTQSLWHNSLIKIMDIKPVFFFYKSWYQIGISNVNQIVKEQPSTLLSPMEFKSEYYTKVCPVTMPSCLYNYLLMHWSTDVAFMPVSFYCFCAAGSDLFQGIWSSSRSCWWYRTNVSSVKMFHLCFTCMYFLQVACVQMSPISLASCRNKEIRNKK